MRPERRFQRLNGGAASLAAPNETQKTPPDISLLRAKNGLDNGVHFTYDNRFGANAWTQDGGGRLDRLTSFYISLPANAHSVGHHVGDEVAGIVYSVGPRVGGPAVTDHKEYAQIYLDAFAEVIAANGNSAIQAIRLCVLSTGVYGPPNPKDKQPMARDAAGIILDALVAGAKLPGAAQLPSTMLVNCSNSMGYERDAFTYAATARGITVTTTGFTL